MDSPMEGSFGSSPEPTPPRVIVMLGSPTSSPSTIDPIPPSRNPFTIQRSPNPLSPTPAQSFNSQNQLDILNSDDPFRSPDRSIPFKINNKRRRQSINSGIRQFSQSGSNSTKPKEAIQKARDLLILAASLEKETEEQSKILDLIEIFREYLEKGKLIKTSNIIILQIFHLENASFDSSFFLNPSDSF
ncbi:hypothetical protein OCU04_012637 [Sclerotinia nivalis]|uniref:Uncharacterized protein n=1 Tax=Sclerotinia nivalis TaxID=352851 RepID=A0A9X0A9Q7_9HELO|nr:hypothetical protein OCU04_012637 [Sclerotinia nivalis]